MIIVILGAVLGAAIGALVARRRKGNVADMLQYGFVFCVIFALAGLFMMIVILRLAG